MVSGVLMIGSKFLGDIGNTLIMVRMLFVLMIEFLFSSQVSLAFFAGGFAGISGFCLLERFSRSILVFEQEELHKPFVSTQP